MDEEKGKEKNEEEKSAQAPPEEDGQETQDEGKRESPQEGKEGESKEAAGKEDKKASNKEEEGKEEAGSEAEKEGEREEEKGRKPKVDLPPGAHLDPILVEEEKEKEETDEEVARRYAAQVEGEEPADEDEKVDEGRTEEPKAEKKEEVKLEKGKTFQATGRRKSSVARVRVKDGGGKIVVNRREFEEFFPRERLRHTVSKPLQVAGVEGNVDVFVSVHGGGVSGQAQAVSHGVARALVNAEPELRKDLKKGGLLTRDPRTKERRKAGLKKARKRPQFSKR